MLQLQGNLILRHTFKKLTWCRADTNSSSETSAAAPVGRWNFMVEDTPSRENDKLCRVPKTTLTEEYQRRLEW